jgi:transposase-like protein
MSSTRCGISAKTLEREIGVSYPTAHRMFKQIRSLLRQDDSRKLVGEVEADETYVGGKMRAGEYVRHYDGRRKPTTTKKKSMIVGAVERGGEVRAQVFPKEAKGVIGPFVKEYVLPESVLFTDEHEAYVKGGREYREHHRIKHSAKIYVEGNVHTNTIEGFWSLVKRGLAGTYHNVSHEYLQSYLDEYVFRFNRRDGREPIFWAILDRVGKSDLAVG